MTYLSFGANSKLNRVVSGMFNARDKAKAVHMVELILDVSILAIWLKDNPDSKASWLWENPCLIRFFRT